MSSSGGKYGRVELSCTRCLHSCVAFISIHLLISHLLRKWSMLGPSVCWRKSCTVRKTPSLGDDELACMAKLRISPPLGAVSSWRAISIWRLRSLHTSGISPVSPLTPPILLLLDTPRISLSVSKWKESRALAIDLHFDPCDEAPKKINGRP